MEESEDNMSAEDIKDVDLLTLKVKPKKRSIVERELETSLTARVTSPRTNGDSTSTSRYGRARRLKTQSESNDTDKLKPLKSPKIEIPVIKSPVYKMHASNSPIKMESPNKINLQCKLENQIENIYNENISLSRFGSAEKKQVSPVGKTPKVYIRKDLIQSKEKEETVTLIKNIFSPVKSNSHLTNILERSSKFNLSKQIGYLDNSSVVKTLDFDGKKKKKDRDVKSMSKSDLFDLEAQCTYQVGDLAWARMGTYPYWPCIVTRDPVSGMFVKKKLFGRVHHDVIHVTFFGDNGRRSWIVDNMLRKFLGQLEFEATRERFTAEAKKKDPRHAAFFVSEKKLPQWNISVEEAETLLREPKRLRIDILNDMLNKSRVFKTSPKGSKKVARTNSDVSLSESLYDTLFSEDDCKTQDSERSRSKTRKKSLDMSEVVTACLDNMAAKTGITKIQKQSHMDRWLEKAKSKTPEKTQLRSRISATKVQNVKRNTKAIKENELKKPFRFIINENDSESLDDGDSKLQSHHNEHDYSNKFPCGNPEVDLVGDTSKELPEITDSDVGNIAKVERLNDVDPNSSNTQDDLEVLIVTNEIVVEPDEVIENTIDDTSSHNNLKEMQEDSVIFISSEISENVADKLDRPEKPSMFLSGGSTNNVELIDRTTDASSLEIINSTEITDTCDEILNKTKTEENNIKITEKFSIQLDRKKINANNQESDNDNMSMKYFNNQLSNGHGTEISSEVTDSPDNKKSEKPHKSAVNVFTNEDTINSSMEWSINCGAEVTTSSSARQNVNASIENCSDVFPKSNKTVFLDEIDIDSIGEDIVKGRPDYEGSKLINVGINEEANETNLIEGSQKREEDNILQMDTNSSYKTKLSEEFTTDDNKVSHKENIKKRNLSTPNIFLYDSADVSEDESVCSEIFYPSNAEETNNMDTLIKGKNCLPLSLDEIINSPHKNNLDPLLTKNCDSNESSSQGDNNNKQHVNECHYDDVACDDSWSLIRVEKKKHHQDSVSKSSKSSSTDTEKNMETNRIFDVTKEKSIRSLFQDFDKDNLSSKDSNYTTSDCDNENLDEPTESSETENVDESTSDTSVQNGYHESPLNTDSKPLEKKYGNFDIGSLTVNVVKLTQNDIKNANNISNVMNKLFNVSKIRNGPGADASIVSTDSEVSISLRQQVWKANEQTLEKEVSKNSSDTSLDCDEKRLEDKKISVTGLGLKSSVNFLQNGRKEIGRNNADSSDKMDITDNNHIANTTLTEVTSKNLKGTTTENTEKSGHLIDKIKEEVDAADTASTVSTESEMSLSIRKQRWKADKQKSEKKAGGMEDPEFLKYVELKQDAIYDEHPELSQEEITAYLYNTWMYEENRKSDRQRTDDLDHANLAKGLQSETLQPKKARKRVNKLDTEKYDVPVKQEVVPKQKTKRKTARPFYNEELYDIDDDIEYFEIFRNKKQEIKIEKAEPESGPSLSNEMDDVEEIDIVEEYFAQLTQPKPNVFKGLLREKVCEICEKTGNLVKCKGCHCMFHVDCVKKATETVELPAPMKGRKKKKKFRGRKLKTEENFDDSNSDDKSHDTNVSEDANTSVENDMEANIVANADDFEAQLALKMKELLGDEQNLQYDSFSSDDELDWSDTEAGKCEIVDIKLKQKKHDLADYSDFKCNNCQKYEEPVCFVCRSPVSPKTNALHRQRCQVPHCNKYYHLDCLEHWPQTQFNSGETARYNKKVNEYFEALSCPRHVCHTCVSDDPRGCKTRFSGDKLAKCVRCPATYHSFTKCLPAGSQILTASHIICPRHYEHRPGKVPCHVNTGWCFICALGGTLICCEYCPTSFHAECLNIKPPEGGYMCEDCETGRLPLYGEMVWVKLGHYRWWPGIILHPCEIPENILAVKHSPGEFVVRFFGQYDHYWVNRGRVFPFQEGDSGKVSSQKSKIDAAFTMAMEHAQRACEILKTAAPNEEESDIASSLLPPHYVRLRVNRPCGPLVARRADEEGSLTQCECAPADDDPCGPYSQCLNRMLLTECGPTCRAGDRCNNRAFEKRLYPKLVPYRTPHRGWGLKTLEDIKAGQFVIEYVGELIDEAEFERRMRRKHDIRDENFYFLTLDKERMIDAGPKGNLARFMNHCCEPNCETQKWTVLGDVRVGLFALYDIPANSEVTFNYNLESTGVEKKRCMCGAKRCSGYIGAKPKQSDPPKKLKVAPAKRTYKKRKIDDSPTTKVKPKLKQGRPIKPRELTEIEKDLLIIKSATNGISSDSECSDRLSSIESSSGRASKRRRAVFSTEDVSSSSSSPSTKRMRLEKCSEYDQNI